MTLDLNQLANIPGYGKAQNIVKNTGFWREDYTFDDVVDMLSNKDVFIYMDGEKICDFHDYEYTEFLEMQLREAMEV